MINITIKKPLFQEMLEGFEEEIKENEKILKGRPSDFNRQRAIERLAVVRESMVELRKQIVNPQRHQMLKEGINPESEELYKAQTQQVPKPSLN